MKAKTICDKCKADKSNYFDGKVVCISNGVKRSVKLRKTSCVNFVK